MTRREAAMENFKKGYNCSQAIVLAFADMLPVDRTLLLRLASSFGGGMGRLREVCGSVSGMFMIAGLLYGYDGPETGQIKAEHYAGIQELAKRFEEKHGTIICREMLGPPRRVRRSITKRGPVLRSSGMQRRSWISISGSIRWDSMAILKSPGRILWESICRQDMEM